MKYFLKHLLFCTVIMLLNVSLYAQLSQRVITITRSKMDIPGLAKMIAAQTGVEYSLNMQNTSLKKNVTLRLGKWKLEDVMKAVQEQAGLNYKIIGDHILFTDYKPVKKDSILAGKPANVPVAKPQGIKTVKKTAHKQISQPARGIDVAPVAPSYTLSPLRTDLLMSQPALNVKPNRLALKTQKENNIKEPITKEKTPKERRHISLPQLGDLPLAEAGLTANDIVYLSASAKAGIQYVYGIGTLGFTSRGLRFRYGAGLRLPLDEYSAVQAEFTTGALSRKSIDSFPQGGLLHERLNSYGLSWSRTIRPRVHLQLEVNYSTLKKSGDSTVHIVNKETNYYGYGKPLYNAKIGGNGNYYELNSWVGFRISLFYNLRRNND